MASCWAAYLNGYAEGGASMKVTVGRPCDFGEEETVDDNLPEDIDRVGVTNSSSPSAAYPYGDGRTFSCMAAYNTVVVGAFGCESRSAEYVLRVDSASDPQITKLTEDGDLHEQLIIQLQGAGTVRK